MARKPRKQKPYVHTEITCPNCKASIELKVLRDKVSPGVPAEYEFRHVIQLLMVPPVEGKNKTKVTKKK